MARNKYDAGNELLKVWLPSGVKERAKNDLRTMLKDLSKGSERRAKREFEEWLDSLDELVADYMYGDGYAESLCEKSRKGMKVAAHRVAEEARARRVAKRARARENRRAHDDAMRSLGLTKVRGNLGGVYWE